MVKKGLLISPVFPPSAFPESHLMAKLLSSLPNYEFDVVTLVGWKKWFGEDGSFETLIKENFGVVEYLTVPKLLQWIPFGKLGPLGKLPDSYRILNFLLFKKAKRMIIENDYQVMVTWSQPHSSHLVGLKLKSSLNAPPKWVAHFSDPWPSNPFFEVEKWIKRINEKKFIRVINQADAITVTNDYVMLTENKYFSDENRKKVNVVPHSFLPSMYSCVDKSKTSKPIILRYIGTFYGLRRPDPILSALALLEANQPSMSKELRVEFIGAKLDAKALKDIQKLKLTTVEVLPSVSFRESLRLMQSANLLLIVDAPLKISPFLPSKLIDYIGSNVPILCFSPPGPSADLVKKLGGWVASPVETDMGYEMLKNALGVITSEGFAYSPPIEIVENFKSLENGKSLVKIFEQITRDKL